jgi:hypothetical protein
MKGHLGYGFIAREKCYREFTSEKNSGLCHKISAESRCFCPFGISLYVEEFLLCDVLSQEMLRYDMKYLPIWSRFG